MFPLTMSDLDYTHCYIVTEDGLVKAEIIDNHDVNLSAYPNGIDEISMTIEVYPFKPGTYFDQDKMTTPLKAWSNPPYTIVQFSDDEKEVVKCADDKPYDFYAGYCIAIVKHMMGNATAVEKSFENAKFEATGRRKMEREAEKARIKRVKAINRRMANELFKREVKAKMYRLRVEQEAQKRLIEEEAEKGNYRDDG